MYRLGRPRTVPGRLESLHAEDPQRRPPPILPPQAGGSRGAAAVSANPIELSLLHHLRREGEVRRHVAVLLQRRDADAEIDDGGLELIRRGFHLVADDMIVVKCLSDSVLVGRAADLLPYHMEARGLGIIDISRLFGAASIRKEKRITLAITLEVWDESNDYDRTGLDDGTLNILDVEVPHVAIPVSPGRNVGTLVEVAALNQKLKSLGIHTARLMEQKLMEQMLKKGS